MIAPAVSAVTARRQFVLHPSRAQHDRDAGVGLREVVLGAVGLFHRDVQIAAVGGGIEKKYLDKIYERGFSTNSGNRGIGLSLVKEKVSSLSGEIKVTSKINKGTTFKISIPKEDTYD
mgnify:CR=1 FL=1